MGALGFGFLETTGLYKPCGSRGRPTLPRLLRGDDVLALGVEPGPGSRLLDLVAEEQAAGTISTREQALELLQRELQERHLIVHPTGGVPPSPGSRP